MSLCTLLLLAMLWTIILYIPFYMHDLEKERKAERHEKHLQRKSRYIKECFDFRKCYLITKEK